MADVYTDFPNIRTKRLLLSELVLINDSKRLSWKNTLGSCSRSILNRLILENVEVCDDVEKRHGVLMNKPVLIGTDTCEITYFCESSGSINIGIAPVDQDLSSTEAPISIPLEITARANRVVEDSIEFQIALGHLRVTHRSDDGTVVYNFSLVPFVGQTMYFWVFNRGARFTLDAFENITLKMTVNTTGTLVLANTAGPLYDDIDANKVTVNESLIVKPTTGVDINFTTPTAGSSGYLLATDGLGSTYWTNPPAGGGGGVGSLTILPASDPLTLNDTHFLIRCGGNNIITLPSATSVAAREYVVFNTGADTTIQVSGLDKIDGNSITSIVARQYDKVRIMSSGVGGTGAWITV